MCNCTGRGFVYWSVSVNTSAIFLYYYLPCAHNHLQRNYLWQVNPDFRQKNRKWELAALNVDASAEKWQLRRQNPEISINFWQKRNHEVALKSLYGGEREFPKSGLGWRGLFKLALSLFLVAHSLELKLTSYSGLFSQQSTNCLFMITQPRNSSTF